MYAFQRTCREVVATAQRRRRRHRQYSRISSGLECLDVMLHLLVQNAG